MSAIDPRTMASNAKRVKAIEEENAKLKKLLAELMLDVSTLREMLRKTSEAQFEERAMSVTGPRTMASATNWAITENS
ncbi:hypothetical protein LX81_03995 [Palleronia aestuarii]|uniref:Transposase n=1 Tax=Palleronia aestuarii TaxID=568105 RepID=A0A2W7MYN5_9RHOB|nr:hypothetical protein LX81_03995 [Palleronia aestuarii]